MALFGLTERELEGDVDAPSIIDDLVHHGVDALPSVRNAPDIRSYVERALRGGLPDVARQASARVRLALLSSYVDQGDHARCSNRCI